MNETWYFIWNDPLASARMSIIKDFLTFFMLFLALIFLPTFAYFKKDMKKTLDVVNIIVSGGLLFISAVFLVYFFMNYFEIKQTFATASYTLTMQHCAQLGGLWACEGGHNLSAIFGGVPGGFGNETLINTANKYPLIRGNQTDGYQNHT